MPHYKPIVYMFDIKRLNQIGFLPLKSTLKGLDDKYKIFLRK